MAWKLTRREFLKKTAYGTTALGVASLGLDLTGKELIECKNCSSVNLLFKPNFSSLLLPEEPLYCHDCGINLRSQVYDLVCSHQRQCRRTTSYNRDRAGSTACAQIPFPNHNYLRKTKKPNFSMKDLQF